MRVKPNCFGFTEVINTRRKVKPDIIGNRSSSMFFDEFLGEPSTEDILNLIEETEDKDKMDDKTYEKEIERSHDDIRKLTDRITEMQKHIEELEENLTAAAEQNVVLIKQIKELENKHDNDKYQQLCIKNNQLSVTIDTLIDKISMLKAVGCYGR